MGSHTLRRRRPTRLTLIMALVWLILIAAIIAGFHYGDGAECLLRAAGQGGGTTCD